MSSILSSFKQMSPDSSHFIAIATTKAYTPASVAAVAAAGSGSLVTSAAPLASIAVGSILKDMGKTVIAPLSDGTTMLFRKIQYVNPTSPRTNGITGPAPGDGTDYSVGYVLLGISGAGPNTTVAGSATYIVSAVAKYGL